MLTALGLWQIPLVASPPGDGSTQLRGWDSCWEEIQGFRGWSLGLWVL